jgi:hypothetical protein
VRLRGKILEGAVNVYPEMPELPENHWKIAQVPHWVTFVVDLVDWEHSIAHAVSAVDPIETNRRRDTESGQRIPLDTYWRTLIGIDNRKKDQSVAINWYHDFHTACEHIKGLVVNYDIFVK